MPPTPLGAAAAVLALMIWLLGRRRPVVLLSSVDTSAVAALNRAQITLTTAPDGLGTAAGEADCPERSAVAPLPLPPPADLRARAVYLARLRAQLDADGPSRLAAMRAARCWGHSSALPLLHRGLRDADLEVVREAVLGLERFRGRTPCGAAQPPPLPRNVSRTL